MLEHVFVLQQELVHSRLGLQPCRSLSSQLILQQVNLQRAGGRKTERRRDKEKERGITTNGSCQWMARAGDAPFHTQFQMKEPCTENWGPRIVMLEKWSPALWTSLYTSATTLSPMSSAKSRKDMLTSCSVCEDKLPSIPVLRTYIGPTQHIFLTSICLF